MGLSDIRTETTVKGNVSDITRGIPIKNFKVALYRFWDPVSQYAVDSELVDTVRTDKNGDYKIKFDFIDGNRYGFRKQYYGIPYYTEFLYGSRIVPGRENTQNIDAWYPTILKLNIKLKNNEHPPLRIISSRLIKGKYESVGATADFFEKNIDSIVYLRSKPKFEIKIIFTYATGYSNADFHKKEIFSKTSLLDTINFSLDIDSSTF